MAMRFIVAIALSALIGLSCGRPTTDSTTVYPGQNGANPTYQKDIDISFLYKWLKAHKTYGLLKPVAETKPNPEPVSKPKPEPYYPYMPNVVPPHTHVPKQTLGHTHTVTHSRTAHHVLPPQFPYGYNPFPYGFPSRFQIPPYPYPTMKPVNRYPFPPTFGFPFNQQQKEQKNQGQVQNNYHPKYPIFPPTIGPVGPVRNPFLPPYQPAPYPIPFTGFPYGQPNVGKFGGYATNVYNSVGNGNGVYGNRFISPGSYGFSGILNAIKGSSSIPFPSKPYPIFPSQPRYGY
ncbi:Hypothetical predicted protein [Octopus vulgaris]|uniref:Uncharacterized protein n=1 Tax=Octopus vulgaris TaxID=6645 RepID=A0AA36HH91_OCTVU|nr:Hypothetical predicted protein [Octopus vulgaris]